MLKWTLGCIYHFKLWFSPDICPGVELEDHVITLGFPSGSAVKNMPTVQEMHGWSLDREDPLKEGMANHSNIFASKIPWTEEPESLESMKSQRVGHDWSNWVCTHGRSNFSFLRNLHTVLYSGGNKLHSHQGYRSFFFSCTPSPEFIISRLFDDGHSDWCDVVCHCSFHLQFSNN